jgi:hypothetical protein
MLVDMVTEVVSHGNRSEYVRFYGFVELQRTSQSMNPTSYVVSTGGFISPAMEFAERSHFREVRRG